MRCIELNYSIAMTREGVESRWPVVGNQVVVPASTQQVVEWDMHVIRMVSSRHSSKKDITLQFSLQHACIWTYD